jgi:hypothetical protein
MVLTTASTALVLPRTPADITNSAFTLPLEEPIAAPIASTRAASTPGPLSELRLCRAAACTPPELCAAASASTIRIVAFHRRQQQRQGGSIPALRQYSDEDDLAV